MTFFGLALVSLAAPLLAATELPADQLPPLPTYRVARAPRAISIDGQVAEGEWSAAEPVVLQYWWPEQSGPRQRTEVRLLWDDEALYVCYVCEDEDITAVHTERDDPTYRDDCCEIFIQPDPERKPTAYIGLEMNARAVLYDYFTVLGVALVRRFDLTGWQLMTRLDGTLNVAGDQDRGWVLEVKIPFANFDDLTRTLPPAPGTTWRCQLNRWDGTEPHRALSLWTHSGMKGPNPHNPERFGYLVFEGAAPTAASTGGERSAGWRRAEQLRTLR